MLNRNLLRLDWGKKLLLVSAALVAALIPFLAGIARAQSDDLRFEVASIRLLDPNAPVSGGTKGKSGNGGNGGTPSQVGGGRFIWTDNAFRFLTFAFRIPGCRMAVISGEPCPLITGEPSWMKQDRYLIQATTPPRTKSYDMSDYIEGRADELYAMLQSLFPQRFNLKYHFESKEVSVYRITVARNGPKLPPSQGKMMTMPDGTSAKERAFIFRVPPEGNGSPDLILHVRAFSLKDMASVLSDIMNRPVYDTTDIPGEFDFDMRFPRDPDNPGVATELRGPGLFTAFQEQLGLRLEAAKQRMDVLVIDHIDRPSEN